METELFEASHTETEMASLVQLVCFNIGNETFGVNILMVKEIIIKSHITPIPDSPDFIEGVINLRGNIIPVIDLRKRLGLFDKGRPDTTGWIIILNIHSRVAGFIVDKVTRVRKISPEGISQPPDLVVTGLKNQYIRGVCNLEEGILVLLDFDCILQVDEIKKLKELKKY